MASKILKSEALRTTYDSFMCLNEFQRQAISFYEGIAELEQHLPVLADHFKTHTAELLECLAKPDGSPEQLIKFQATLSALITLLALIAEAANLNLETVARFNSNRRKK